MNAKELVQKAKEYLSHEDVSKIDGAYHSWEHCYDVFHTFRDKPALADEDYDFLSLHLAFYLASWGMYRASSPIKRFDYKVHKKVVEILMDEKYKVFYSSCDISTLEENFELFWDLSNSINDYYKTKFHEVRETKYVDVSDTLVTKVLMGTVGCVPAYDTYFVKGISKYNKGIDSKKDRLIGTYGENSLKALISFYRENYDLFEAERMALSKNYRVEKKYDYPQMKMMDNAFFQLGLK